MITARIYIMFTAHQACSKTLFCSLLGWDYCLPFTDEHIEAQRGLFNEKEDVEEKKVWRSEYSESLRPDEQAFQTQESRGNMRGKESLEPTLWEY